jgi:hypothetical protein
MSQTSKKAIQLPDKISTGLTTSLNKKLNMKKLSGKLKWKGNAVKAQQNSRMNDR